MNTLDAILETNQECLNNEKKRRRAIKEQLNVSDAMKERVASIAEEFYLSNSIEYNKFYINHRSKRRKVYSLDSASRRKLLEVIPYLEDVLYRNDFVGANYAFEKGKNCVQGALHHVGYKYTLSFDLENFFDSITPEHVMHLIDHRVLDLCFIDGAPRQGLPTSPLISVIAFLKGDKAIVDQLKMYDISSVYTRYADDLTISFNSVGDKGKIITIVNSVVESTGFSLNKRKYKYQTYMNGRRIITGVGVDFDGVHPTRRTLKKIRAAKHQQCYSSLDGLIEWSKCKLPH